MHAYIFNKCYIFIMRADIVLQEAFYISDVWKALKCSAGEGWRSPVGPLVCEVKNNYKDSRTRGTSYKK